MLGRILVTLGGLVVVALFVALLAPFFVDWTSFRQEFEDRSSRILGKKVTVHGTVSARLLPFPSLSMQDVTIGADLDGSPLVTIEQFSLDAELAPLLSGEARIFDMRIEQPRARIRLLENGELDWLRGSKPTLPARTVVLENLTVTGGAVEFIDQQTGRNRLITDLDAKVSARTLAGPWSIDGRAVLDGEAGHFTLNSTPPTADSLPLRLRLQPDTRPVDINVDGALTLREGRPVYEGRFDAMVKAEMPEEQQSEEPAPAPRIRGEVEFTNESIAIPSYRLEVGDVADPYVVTGTGKLDTGAKPEFSLTAEGQQIDVAKLEANSSTGKTSRVGAISLKHRLDVVLRVATAIPIPSVPGKASLRLPAIVAGDTVFRDIQLDVRPDGQGWAVEKAVAVLPGRTQVEASGALMLGGAPSFEGDLLIASTQPSGLATWLSGNVDPAIRQLRSAGLSASVNLTSQLQRFEKLELALGSDPLKGRMERETSENAGSSLSIDLSGDVLNLDAARAIAALVTGQDEADKIVADKVAARLQLSKLVALGVEAEQIDAILRYADGRLEVERLNVGDLAGATLRLAGNFAGKADAPAAKGRVTISAADPAGLLGLVKERYAALPALERFLGASRFYADTDVTLDVALSETGALTVAGEGRSNGSQVRLNYTGSVNATGERAVDVELKNDDAGILMGQVGMDPLPLPVGDGGTITLKIAADDKSGGELSAVYQAQKTRLELTGEATDLATGLLADGSWSFAIDSADLAPYLLALKANLPDLQVGLPVKGNLAVKVAKGVLSTEDFTAEIVGQPVKGRVDIDLTAARPRLKGTIATEQLDLAWLAETVTGPLRDAQSGELAQTELSSSTLPIDVSLKLAADRLWVGAVEAVQDFAGSFDLSAREAVLEVERGNWLGGAAAGRLFLANAEGAGLLQAKLTVNGADVARTLEGLRTERGFERGSQLAGRASLTLVLEGTGATPAALIGGVTGSGEMVFERLQVTGLKLGILPEIIESADAIGTAIDQEAVRGIVSQTVPQDSAKLDGLKLQLSLADRILRVQNAAFKAEAAALGGDMRLDLQSGNVEGLLKVALDAGDATLEGAVPALGLALTGPFVAPAVTYDVTELTNFLALRAFELERRRVEALQSSVLEKQRLRRESALARARIEERARQDAERAKQEEQTRKEAEAAAAAKAAEEAARAAAATSGSPAPEVPNRAEAVSPPQQPSAPAATSPAPGPTGATAPERRLSVSPAERVVRQPLPEVRF